MIKECLGRTAGGLTSKIHAVVDALGNPLKIILTAGQVSDITQAQSLTSDIGSCRWIADKGYDCDYFVNTLYEKHCTPIIPSRKNRLAPRTIDNHVYKERHLIECFFNKIKWFRRVHVRYDKTSAAYLAFVHLASTFVWLS